MFEDKRDNKSFNEFNKFFMPDEDYKEPTSNFVRPRINNYSSPSSENKNKNKVLLILIPILLIIAIIVLIASIILMLTKTKEPYEIYTDLIKDTFKNINGDLESYTGKSLDYNFSEDSLGLNGTLKFNTNIDTLKNYNNTYDYKLVLDSQKKALDFEANYAKDEESKNIKAYIRDKIILLENKAIYDKLMNIFELKDFIWDLNFQKIDAKDLNTIMQFLENYTIKSLNKNKLTKENSSLNLEGKNYNVTNNIYKLSKDEVKELLKNLIKDASNNNELLDAFKNITGTSRTEIKSYLASLIETDYLNITEDLTLNVYTKGKTGEILSVKVLFGQNEIYSKDYINNKIYTNIKGFKLDITKEGNNKKIKVTSENNEIGTININKNSDITKIKVDAEYLGYTIELDLNIEQKGIGNKRQTLKVDFEGVITHKKEKTILKINLDNKTEIGGSSKEIMETDYVNVNNLNNNEKKKIIAALENLKSPLYNSWKQKLEEEVETNEENCLNAYDCTCESNICSCKYLDSKYQEHSITCIK